MNKFNWIKAFSFGVLIWAVMAVALWILGSIESIGPVWAHGIVAVVGGVFAFLFARATNAESGTQAAEYGLVWAIIVMGFDLVITQFLDAHIFASWQYWAGAGLVFLAPWLQTEARQVLVGQPA
jgi:uncharacterized membrane protein YadS